MRFDLPQAIRPRIGIVSAIVVTALFACRSDAAVTLVTTRAGLGGTDSIDWGVLGPPPTTNVLSPFWITSTVDAVPITVSQSGGFFVRRDQGPFWPGDFAPGDELLWTGGNNGPITIDFGATFLDAFGLQIQINAFGAFTAQLEIFDGSTSIGLVTELGNSTSNNDNSAIFIGIDSDTPFNSVVVSLISGSNLRDFAVNQADFVQTSSGAVPEASSLIVWSLLGILGTCVGFVRHIRGKIAD